MKKVSAVVVYDKSSYLVKAITVIRKHSHISLISAKSQLQLASGISFNDMYSKVLSLLKANNMYTGYTEAFGARFYDIVWVDSVTFAIEQYGYRKEGGVL